MKNCTKLPVTKNQIEPLCSKYNINQILASIFIRRGINQGEDILYFLENDIRFQHSPFCFPVMEDIVSPASEETVWYNRIYNGMLQRRLWSITYRKWLTEWEDVAPVN